MFDKLVSLSFDLYDVYSGIVIEISAGTINVRVDEVTISLLVEKGLIYPEVIDSHGSKDIDTGLLIEILHVIEQYRKEK